MSKFLIVLLMCLPGWCQDSSMFRASLQHSGSYRGEGTARFGDIKWKFHTNGQVISSPAVANNTVYVGSNDHYLYALDLATGIQKWKFKTGSRVTSSPAVFNGNVYFGSYDGYYYAVNSKTGRSSGSSKLAVSIGLKPNTSTEPSRFQN